MGPCDVTTSTAKEESAAHIKKFKFYKFSRQGCSAVLLVKTSFVGCTGCIQSIFCSHVFLKILQNFVLFHICAIQISSSSHQHRCLSSLFSSVCCGASRAFTTFYPSPSRSTKKRENFNILRTHNEFQTIQHDGNLR